MKVYAFILRGHLEKNPGADPIYYDLLGRALEDTDADAAEKLYRTAIERGELESYYSLANLYRKKGNAKRAQEVADEGAGKGAVNCSRFRAGLLDDETFGGFPSEYKEKLHRQIAEELEVIGAPEDGGFEEYDDPDLMDEDDDYSTGWEQEIEEDMVTADTAAESAEPKEVTISSDRIQEGLDQCNLCRDTLIITYPNTRDFWFRSSEDLFNRFRIKSPVEDNIKRHGGYMIDEWQYVDERQTPIDLRARVRFQPEEENQ